MIVGAVIGTRFVCGGGGSANASRYEEALVSRIAFGSCANQTAPQVPSLLSFLFLFHNLSSIARITTQHCWTVVC